MSEFHGHSLFVGSVLGSINNLSVLLTILYHYFESRLGCCWSFAHISPKCTHQSFEVWPTCHNKKPCAFLELLHMFCSLFVHNLIFCETISFVLMSFVVIVSFFVVILFYAGSWTRCSHSIYWWGFWSFSCWACRGINSIVFLKI